jgi:predicted nuclease with TOPRIM domain
MDQAMTDLVARLRETGSDLADDAADEIERLKVDCDRLREFNTKLCTEIDRLRSLLREMMSALLVAQEDDQMSSAGYRGEWLGELIETCQRGLENREAPK